MIFTHRIVLAFCVGVPTPVASAGINSSSIELPTSGDIVDVERRPVDTNRVRLEDGAEAVVVTAESFMSLDHQLYEMSAFNSEMGMGLLPSGQIIAFLGRREAGSSGTKEVRLISGDGCRVTRCGIAATSERSTYRPTFPRFNHLTSAAVPTESDTFIGIWRSVDTNNSIIVAYRGNPEYNYYVIGTSLLPLRLIDIQMPIHSRDYYFTIISDASVGDTMYMIDYYWHRTREW